MQFVELDGWERQFAIAQEVFAGEDVVIRSMPNGFYCYTFPDLKNTCDDLCVNPWMSCSIQCNGNVSSCCVAMGDDIIYGNVKMQTLREIWEHSSEVKKLREEHMARSYRPICSKCYVRSPYFCHQVFFFTSILKRKTT